MREFSVDGHRVTYEGQFTVAFRLDERGRLLAVAGHSGQKIAVDGREFTFASAPMALTAWAPVQPERRVPGGAALELWVQGEAELSVPLPAGTSGGDLFFQGPRLDALGDKVACECSGEQQQFKSLNAWGQRRLYFVPR